MPGTRNGHRSSMISQPTKGRRALRRFLKPIRNHVRQTSPPDFLVLPRWHEASVARFPFASGVPSNPDIAPLALAARGSAHRCRSRFYHQNFSFGSSCPFLSHAAALPVHPQHRTFKPALPVTVQLWFKHCRRIATPYGKFPCLHQTRNDQATVAR